MRNIGNRIKFIREKNRLTQEGLAEKSGVNRSLISKIENNVSTGSLSTLSKIAAALGLTVAELLDDTKAG